MNTKLFPPLGLAVPLVIAGGVAGFLAAGFWPGSVRWTVAIGLLWTIVALSITAIGYRRKGRSTLGNEESIGSDASLDPSA